MMASLRRSGRQTLRVRLYALSVSAIILIALATRLAYVIATGVHPTPTDGPVRTIPDTDVNPYGANFFLDREVEPWKLDKTLQMASQAGIGWVKQQFSWEEVEPRRKGEFLEPATKSSSWGKFDAIVTACEKHDLRIIARLDRPPDWTRQDNSYKERPPDNFQDYGDYVYEFVKRYRGRIDYIQIWNEPNIFPEWGNRPVDPTQYVELLKIAYRRAKEANPNVHVLCAPLAITLGQPHPEPGKWTAMNDIDYLEEMYKAGAARYFDIYSANAFGMDRPPDDLPDPSVLNFQRVLLHREVMERYGDGHKAVWFNEYGWNAAPESFPEDRLVWQRVTEREQADYSVRGITMAREQWPWAGVFMIWYFRQAGHIPTERADYYFRMVDTDFTPRPLYLAIQSAATTRTMPGPGTYQESNPGIVTRGQWETVMTPRASGGAYWRSETAGDSLEFTFRGPGINLIAPQSPDGGRFLVSLDGRTVPGLPTNDQGRSYVDMYSDTAKDQAVVSLAHSLGPETHILTLEISSEHHPASSGQGCAIDALRVASGERGSLPLLPLAVVLAALALNLALLWRTWRRARWLLRTP
jgi:hypothetical protein